ncbi:type II toxin-antitoxin system VapC family toxin [Ciceribacter sp. L1K22]|uniref:type II toxin-antitoxin system VapC family toxin n=1 Tax=Ciceribacter sp. L1K22 TaxID=2820275 RepID=UPI001ABE07A6|nr:type II toxin-antitoxin system VapC family toxin [Ciceribacter sp. L1K22]MBO3759296.1 type II toxin-antitoxin system VapC family toxin [Ciceribacter sp. L1K22]
MVIDSSAVVAIALDEPDADELERKIADDPVRLMSTATLLELSIVIETRLGEAGSVELDHWLRAASVELVGVDIDQVEIARRAWRRYGKGRHLAGLNYGDCFSYALATATGEPLLFKGRDFTLTDIRVA